MRVQKFFSNDDYYLLRQHMYKHAKNVISNLKQTSAVLEIGPSSSVYNEKIEEYNTSIISKFCKDNSIQYETLDIAGNANYIGSIENMEFINKKFDIIIALGVLEHVANIFSVPSQIYNHLNDFGKFFVNVPFLFKVHGPIPDYWRISEFGFKYLFSDKFNLEFDSCPENEFGKNSFPLSLNIICVKK
jgi:cyclopropane fatty-acyl-phospholipid synthase-like methyltransferase